MGEAHPPMLSDEQRRTSNPDKGRGGFGGDAPDYLAWMAELAYCAAWTNPMRCCGSR